MPGDGWAPSAGRRRQPAPARCSASISASEIMPGRSSVGSPGQRQHGRFDAHLRRAAIQHAVHRVAQRLRERARRWSARAPVKRLALGAAMGTPAARISSSASGCARHAHADRRQSRGDDVGNRRPLSAAPASAAPASSARASFSAAGGHSRHQPARHLDRMPHARSADWSRAVPSPRKSAPPPRHRARSRPGRRPFRWETRPARRRESARAASAISELTRADRPCRRPPSCRSCARPDRRGSAAPDRHRARGPHRRWRAWCDDP